MILSPSSLKPLIYHEMFLRSSCFAASLSSAIVSPKGARSAFPAPPTFSPAPVSSLSARAAMAPLSTASTDKRAEQGQKNEQDVVPLQPQVSIPSALLRLLLLILVNSYCATVFF
ncbi:hypothetical protein KSP40_PGU020501 [Platanthera guangdongensis]|uniref:Transmembrane protein n=1 Tax=Platanthera guangdongensis TaxID=2320717 RepID=A0ABR2N5J4_9ASPA